MMRIVGIALLSNLLFGLVAQPVQSELYKLLDVLQPRRLFSIKHRVNIGEGGISLSKLFLISYNRKYFYITFHYTPFDPFHSVQNHYIGPIINCYDHNGQLVSTIRVFSESKELIKELEELYKMDKSEREKRQIYSPASIICATSIEDDKLCLLVSIYDVNKDESVYKFLVFTPQGKIDKEMSSKLNDMIEKLNKDINNKIIDDMMIIFVSKMIINNRKDNIILFGKIAEMVWNIRISGNGDYSVTKIPLPEWAIPGSSLFVISDIDLNGNIIIIICNKEKPEELIIRIFRIDKDYKNPDEFKIRIDKKITQYLDPPPINFIADARGHIFIVFALKETLPKHEWQVSYYKPEHDETPYEHVVAAFPGYIVYEFDPSGQPVGPRALLQTMINLAAYNIDLDEDIDIELQRFTLDNQGNLYYLHYRPDGTEVWMVPRPTR